MIVLSIDSASKVATAALLDENNLIAEYTINNKLEHSTLIMDIVDKLLKNSNLDIDDIIIVERENYKELADLIEKEKEFDFENYQ